MARILKFQLESLEYEMILQNDILKIVIKHTNEQLMWSTIIDSNMFGESYIIKTSKNINVDYDPEEYFDIFDKYYKNTLDSGFKITFPIMCDIDTTNNMQIIIEFMMPIGKKCDRKTITLLPENISHEIIVNAKIDHLKQKINESDEYFTKAINLINNEIAQLKNHMQQIETLITNSNKQINENENLKINAICQQVVASKFGKLRNLLIEDIKTYNNKHVIMNTKT